MGASGLAGVVKRAEAHLAAEHDEPKGGVPWDWYAQSCPCGVPPGECRAHPRARLTQRPPAGDWRVWAYVAGRGAGKTRAGAAWIQHRALEGTMKLGCLIAPTAADIRDVRHDRRAAGRYPRCASRGEQRWSQPPPGPCFEDDGMSGGIDRAGVCRLRRG